MTPRAPPRRGRAQVSIWFSIRHWLRSWVSAPPAPAVVVRDQVVWPLLHENSVVDELVRRGVSTGARIAVRGNDDVSRARLWRVLGKRGYRACHLHSREPLPPCDLLLLGAQGDSSVASHVPGVSRLQPPGHYFLVDEANLVATVVRKTQMKYVVPSPGVAESGRRPAPADGTQPR